MGLGHFFRDIENKLDGGSSAGLLASCIEKKCMGVNFGGLFPTQEISFEQLNGKTIAIDAFNVMFQFLSSIRDRFTGEPLRDSKGNVTSHLAGLFQRTAKLMEYGITPVYVFDGKPPEFKRKTIQAREKIREEAREKWKEALETGDVEAVRKYSQGASQLTTEMIQEAKRLVEAMGISCIQAPSEGEAQAAYFARKGLVWAIGSQDWDSLLFNTPRLIKNLTSSGKRKVPGKERYIEVNPELVDLDSVLSHLGFNLDQLILTAILIGTDYNPGGVKGIGPKKALELVKKERTLEGVSSQVSWEFDIKMEEIFDFFKNPPIEELEITKMNLDEHKLKQILIDDHNFSQDRVESTINKIKDVKKVSGSTLSRFLGK